MYPALSMLLDGSAGELTSKQRKYIEILERNAERLERLIAGAAESGWLDCARAPTEPAAAIANRERFRRAVASILRIVPHAA
jgi:hypothetical protein